MKGRTRTTCGTLANYSPLEFYFKVMEGRKKKLKEPPKCPQGREFLRKRI
jgi:hypothetical protein